jgi:ABC-2 type transport system permease protein
MTFADRLYTLWFTAQLSWRDFLAHFPPKAYLLSMIPRAVLQVTFLGYLGYYAAGDEGREFAFVGACTQIMVLETVVRGPDVVVQERVLGTLHRLRLGVYPLPAIMCARWWIYICAGVGDAIVAIFLAGLLVGELELAPELLAALPLFLLVAITTSTIGLVVGAVSLTQRVDTLLANGGAYALMVFGGVVAPISAFGETGEVIARCLPLTNGLLAIRAAVAGESWLRDAALELGVGALWAVVAVALIQIQAHRARARGSDELL